MELLHWKSLWNQEIREKSLCGSFRKRFLMCDAASYSRQAPLELEQSSGLLGETRNRITQREGLTGLLNGTLISRFEEVSLSRGLFCGMQNASFGSFFFWIRAIDHGAPVPQQLIFACVSSAEHLHLKAALELKLSFILKVNDSFLCEGSLWGGELKVQTYSWPRTLSKTIKYKTVWPAALQEYQGHARIRCFFVNVIRVYWVMTSVTLQNSPDLPFRVEMVTWVIWVNRMPLPDCEKKAVELAESRPGLGVVAPRSLWGP